MSFLKFSLVFTNIFLVMHVTFSQDLVGIHSPLISLGSMASKRITSKDTDGSETRAIVE